MRYLSLRTEIICIFTAIGVIAVSGGILMLWYSYQSEVVFSRTVQKELALYRITRDMELGLANQKGFLTYYFVDGDLKWLRSLKSYRDLFNQSLAEAITLDLDGDQKAALQAIAVKYGEYTTARDVAIENYKKSGNLLHDSISDLHEKQRDVFFTLLGLCQAFSRSQWEEIERAKRENALMSSRLRSTTSVAICLLVFLSILFLYILYRQILSPIRELAIESGISPLESSRDEVHSLRQSLQEIMRDFGETHDELTRSRKHLVQAERMAMVGELAAGVAHTIRNPFTSIKMRMFSLTRSLDLNDLQNEDLSVIEEEIDRIDKIVQNFLEFARPPKLKLQACKMGELIRSVIVLLEYRLKEYDARLIYRREEGLPDVMVDADRIKEALVNIITNSCEAMSEGGSILISEKMMRDPELGEIIAVSVRDSGPGIPEAIIHKVTAPFFTTKEDGSGLGLSIVNRIVKEHKGRLVINSRENQCEIKLLLPVTGDAHESCSDN